MDHPLISLDLKDFQPERPAQPTEEERRAAQNALQFQDQINLQAATMMVEAWVRAVLLIQNGQMTEPFKKIINRYASQLAGITEPHADQT